MAKKRKKNYSMKDQFHKDQVKQQPTKSSYSEARSVEEFQFDQEFQNKIIAYNENIKTFHPRYTSINPRFNEVLVRAYLKELTQDENGLYSSNMEFLPVKTQNKIADHAFTPNPFPLTRKAVVVALPKNYNGDLKEGQDVYLRHRPVVIAQGKAKDGIIVIENAFVHPDKKQDYLNGFPESPDDENYGYLMVDDYGIQLTI